MIEFVYPHTHLVAGVGEGGRGPPGGARSDRRRDPRSGASDRRSE